MFVEPRFMATAMKRESSHKSPQYNNIRRGFYTWTGSASLIASAALSCQRI